jgi:GNAT superfamily N-acetyltransferase
MRRTLELAGEEKRPVPGGWVIRTPSLPADWHLNHIHLAEAVTRRDAVRLAREHLDGLPYRHLEVEEGAGAEQLVRALRADGWEVVPEVIMALLTPPESATDGAHVVEQDEERMLALMRRWIVEDERPDPDALAEHVESCRRRARASGERHFGIENGARELVSMTNLRTSGAIAQVENVYTAPEVRGRGYARTLVTHVTRLAADAGHELTFITADANDWPKDLYARLGFEPIGRTWLAHRRV